MFLPAFFWELEQLSRRRWFSHVRRLYIAIILYFFCWYVFDTLAYLGMRTPEHQLWIFRRLTPDYFSYLMGILALSVFLLTPMLAVTGVMQARNRMVLDLLLTTQQRPLEIVGSYWLAAVAKVVLITMPIVPLLLWMGEIWGSPWWAMMGRVACVWLMVLPMAAWSVLVTLRLRRIAPALVAAYAGSFAVWPGLFLFFTEAHLTSFVLSRFDAGFSLRFVGYVAAPTSACLFLAAMRLHAWLEGVRQPGTSPRDLPAHPPVAEAPIFWKQYHLHDFSLIGVLRRLPAWGRVVAFMIVACLACAPPPKVADYTPVFETLVILIVFPIGALILAASTASVERESSTWDPLRLTLIGPEEYFEQTLHAILLRLRTYWLATLPAVVLLTCKGREMCLVVPVIWLIAGGLMRPAATIGLCFSVKSDTSAKSILQALTLFVAVVVGSGFLVFGALVSILVCIEEWTRIAYWMVLSSHWSSVLALLIHVLCTWLFLRELLNWLTKRQLAGAMAYLSQNERLQPVSP